MNSSPDHLVPDDIPSPKLSDDAVIQIHDFIHHVLDLFEARYGDQIHRFYADLCGDNLIDSDSALNLDDPPF
jgi:hypothetical protein